MSIELPEAHILATQMCETLKGKQIAAVKLGNCEKLQKLGCFNKNSTDYDLMVRETINSVISRGAVILTKLGGGKNLLLSPEYGGRILFRPKNIDSSEKFHFKMEFTDNSAFTVALSGFGGVQMLKDDGLGNSYVYRRDFSNVPSPICGEFEFSSFKEGLARKNVNIKTAIVGKDALVVGLSNSIFQDILFRAGIHPKRKASNLSDKEALRLFDAVKAIVKERIRLGGKNLFVDFYGKPGMYKPSMGPNMKGLPCKKCGSIVEAMSLGGGQVFFCPKCQI